MADAPKNETAPVGAPRPILGLLAVGERTTRSFSCERSPNVMPLVHSPGGGQVRIVSQTTRDITLQNLSARAAPFMVFFVDQTTMKRLAALQQLFSSLKR